MPKPKEKSNCEAGFTKFLLSKVPCELMDYYRGLSIKNRRNITSEIIIAMEKNKQEHDVLPNE